MAKLTPAAFKEKFGSAVVLATQGTGIFPSVKLAQLALETGWGASILGNNAFGIKSDSSWKGKVISFTTQEVIGGLRQTFKGTGLTYPSRTAAINAGAQKQTLFREYDSLSDSIADHSKFLLTNGIYAKALKATTPEAQALELEKAGYATSKNYDESLVSIINSYSFKIFDTLKKK